MLWSKDLSRHNLGKSSNILVQRKFTTDEYIIQMLLNAKFIYKAYHNV